MKPIHIIYIPGFGDRYDSTRRRLLKLWHFKNVAVELVPMNWTSQELFEEKLNRIYRAIDAVEDKNVVVIGESAGGSMAVHVYAERHTELFKVMTICGKNSHPETVDSRHYSKHPAFRASMDRLNESIKKLPLEARRRFVSVHPVHDKLVPVNETMLPDCKELVLPGSGHLHVILRALTIWAPRIIREVRR